QRDAARHDFCESSSWRSVAVIFATGQHNRMPRKPRAVKSTVLRRTIVMTNRAAKASRVAGADRQEAPARVSESVNLSLFVPSSWTSPSGAPLETNALRVGARPGHTGRCGADSRAAHECM